MSMINLDEPIPSIKVPSISDYEIIPVDEKIVSLSKAGFYIDSMYNRQGVPGSYPDCYVRESLVPMLKKAESFLPNGLKFKIYDGYRPICVQQRLWNFYRQDIKNKYPELSDGELDFKTSFFVSKPSYDIMKPSLHNTGGAVDLTLISEGGYELNMGTIFDDFTDRSWSNHFEYYENYDEVKRNRRILYNAMVEAGFTNLPSEWWHYDYGDKFWSHFKNKPAIYTGILDIDFPNRFPLS